MKSKFYLRILITNAIIFALGAAFGYYSAMKEVAELVTK